MNHLAAATILALASLSAGSAHAAACTTPAEVAAAFAAGEVCAVDSCLYGVITEGEAAPTHPYPAGFGKAWLSGYRTVAANLQDRHDDGATCAVTQKALTAAGFPPPFDGAPYRFHVIDGCALEKAGRFIAVPTVAEWVRVLMDDHRIAVSMPVFRNLAEAGRDFGKVTGCTGGTDAATGKPTDALACVTGAGFPDTGTCGCGAAFLDAYRDLAGLSPYTAGQTTAACFARYATMTPGEPALRAALWACQDADPYNAFDGLGFDGTELTLPEFIVDNIAFDAMGPDAVAHIALPDPAGCAAE